MCYFVFVFLSSFSFIYRKKHGSSSAAAKTEENARDSPVVKTNLTIVSFSTEEPNPTNSPIIDAETLAKLTSSLATESVRLNISDTEHKEDNVQHQLVSTSGMLSARSLSNQAIAKQVSRNSSSAEQATEEKQNTATIPEKLATSSQEKPASRTNAHTRRSGSKRKNSSLNSSGQSSNQRNAHKNRRKAPRPTATVIKTPLKNQQLQPNRARGTLYGLATLRRQGNVRVNPSADYITVRSNFVLGPLVLKVEKAFGKGTKRELKSATATTTQMIGRVNLRIVNGAATLHSIKVQQPKQVK